MRMIVEQGKKLSLRYGAGYATDYLYQYGVPRSVIDRVLSSEVTGTDPLFACSAKADTENWCI